jgi:hypothetical protein
MFPFYEIGRAQISCPEANPTSVSYNASVVVLNAAVVGSAPDVERPVQEQNFFISDFGLLLLQVLKKAAACQDYRNVIIGLAEEGATRQII